MKKGFISQAIFVAFIGIFAIGLICFLLYYLRISFNRDAERKEELTQSTQQSVQLNVQNPVDQIEVKNYVLKPGGAPVRIDVNGKRVYWEGYRAGFEGKDVLLIRFTLLSGEVTDWENIANEHLDARNLPDKRSIQAIEFGVPKDGSTRGLEIQI